MTGSCARAATRKFEFTPFLPSFTKFCQVLQIFGHIAKHPPLLPKIPNFGKSRYTDLFSVYRPRWQPWARAPGAGWLVVGGLGPLSPLHHPSLIPQGLLSPKTAYSRYKGCTYRERGAAPAHGAGINKAPLYTVAPFSWKLNADEFFIKIFFL